MTTPDTTAPGPAPIRHTIGGIWCVTIPAEEYDRLRKPGTYTQEQYDEQCDLTHLAWAAYNDFRASVVADTKQPPPATAREVSAALAACIAAMEKSVSTGRTDHLDADDEQGSWWYAAISNGKIALNGKCKPVEPTVLAEHKLETINDWLRGLGVLLVVQCDDGTGDEPTILRLQRDNEAR